MRVLCFTFLELRMAFWGWMSLRGRRFSTRFFDFCIKRMIHIYGRMINRYKDFLLEYMDRGKLERLVNGMDVILDYYCTDVILNHYRTNVLELGKEVHDGNH